MSGLNDSNTTDQYDQAQIVMMGGTDNTKIGNLGDKLKVDASVSAAIDTASVESTFRPDPSAYQTDESSSLKLDSAKNLICRSAVHVDEGSFRTDFNNTLETALTGSLSFANGSTTVTGVGTAFLSEILVDHYIKLDIDDTTKYAQVFKLISDTELELYTGYLGATNSGSSKISKWNFNHSGTGSSISIGSSLITINSGTENNGYAYIERNIDYCPLQLYAKLSVAIRQENQTIIFGFGDDLDNPTKEAVLVFDGVSETTCKFRTRSGILGTQETVVLLAATEKSSTLLSYEINVLPNKCVLIINGNIKATHTDRIPFPYDVLKSICKCSNTAAVTSNDITLDILYVSNINIVAISNTFSGEPLKVQIIPSVYTALRGFIDGYIQTASSSQVVIRNTTYTEQSTNAQRSVKSSSANDTSAGTGARTILITYYGQDMVGPYTETLTMNGTTAVVTENSNICFIEKIEVLTAGSLKKTAGTISLYANTAGTGTVIGSIASSTTKTFWCHHYIPPGFTCYVTGITVSTSGTVFGNGGNFTLTSSPVLTANSIDQQISDNLVVPGAVPFSSRIYATPIKVIGPTRVTGWIFPNGSATYNNFMSFDFYEE
jgi:hypothetical protein